MKKYSLWMFIFYFSLTTVVIAQDEGQTDNWVAGYYAPYVYMPRYPIYQLAPTAEATGVRYFTLAFILGGSACDARWVGTAPIDRSYIYDFLIPDLEALRQLGGDVIISFGGAGGTDLAQVCSDVDSLVEQYQRVIDTLGVTHLDFDIEGDDINDADGIARRSEAIAQLQANAINNGSDVIVSYTLPVKPTGLTDAGLLVLESAIEYGVRLDVVNIMTMNFGADFPSEEMGDNTIQSAESLFTQLQALFPEKSEAEIWSMIGLTPMIGMNDRGGEIFELQDAQQVTRFAIERGIRSLSIWSLDRDQPCEFVNVVANDCSGVEEEPFAFSNILNLVTQ